MSDLMRMIKAGGSQGSLCEEHGRILTQCGGADRQGGRGHGEIIHFFHHLQDRPSNDALAVLAARLGLMVHSVRQATTID